MEGRNYVFQGGHREIHSLHSYSGLHAFKVEHFHICMLQIPARHPLPKSMLLSYQKMKVPKCTALVLYDFAAPALMSTMSPSWTM